MNNVLRLFCMAFVDIIICMTTLTLTTILLAETWEREIITYADMARIYLACTCAKLNARDHIWALVCRAYGEKRIVPNSNTRKKGL